ncbi:MAG: prolyl oligopeptidase family serine peptidase [Planctomycetes bacterium]|nr:prolyl oligopeptidase family serine peptidase [Planctomycetota bacterium]
MRPTRILAPPCAAAILLAAVSLAAPAGGGEPAPEWKAPESWLVVGPLPAGRGTFAPDPVAARSLLAEAPEEPKAGAAVPGIEGPWREAKPDEKGRLRAPEFANGYACALVESDVDGAMLVEPRGAYYFYWNGRPFPGDVYQNGAGPVPVPARKGRNVLIARVVRGEIALRTRPAPSPLWIATEDPTLPDVREGLELSAVGAVVVLNASDRPLEGAVLEVADDPGETWWPQSVELPWIPPFGLHKASFPLLLARPLREADVRDAKVPVALRLSAGGAAAEASVSLRFRKRDQSYKETFVSGVDGSVQYYAVRPPSRRIEGAGALYLSLHGASVEAAGQADAYSPKADGWVVAATNRRPFGFDWEDWGRIDALEVLEAAKRRFPVDPDRVYLCGHSMGGHGTWHVAANHPGLFAAIAPSAGWVSIFSYARARKPAGEGPLRILARCLGPSDTLALKENLRDLPAFVLHGDADDNVPVSEARTMVEELKPFHRDFVYREVPKMGHWWDQSPAPGADCVDLAELFAFFARHRRAAAPAQVSFKTMNPGVSAECRWVRIEGQTVPLERSAVEAEARPGLAEVEFRTENVSRLSFDPAPLFRPSLIQVKVDGAEVELVWPGKGRVHLGRDGAAWALREPPAGAKGPARYGPFKAAFDRRFVLVFGTGGTAEEAALCLARARYDAGEWWYRGNGAAEIVPDSRFDPRACAGRNVILYGNEGTNSAFAACLEPSASVRVRPGRLEIGGRAFEGDDLAVLAVLPRRGTEENLVGIVGGTGARGLLGTLRVSYLRSQVGYPDWLAFRLGVVGKGDEALVGCGIFGERWTLEGGETWFREKDGKEEPAGGEEGF